MSPESYTRADLARRWGVNERTILRWEQEIPDFPVGFRASPTRRTHYSAADVHRWEYVTRIECAARSKQRLQQPLTQTALLTEKSL
jgi:DNA-binding XRE family transcriptional regulator